MLHPVQGWSSAPVPDMTLESTRVDDSIILLNAGGVCCTKFSLAMPIIMLERLFDFVRLEWESNLETAHTRMLSLFNFPSSLGSDQSVVFRVVPTSSTLFYHCTGFNYSRVSPFNALKYSLEYP